MIETSPTMELLTESSTLPELKAESTAVPEVIVEGNSALSYLHLIIFSVLILTINIVSIISLARCRYMCKQIWILAINKNITDISLGVALFLTFIIKILPFSCMANLVHLHLNALLMTVSAFTITLIAVDRFLSVYFSMKYQLIMTTKCLVVICLLLWCVSTGLCVWLGKSFDCYGPNIQRSNGILAIIFILCMVIVSFCYVMIFINISKHHHHEKQLNLPYNVSLRMHMKALSKVTIIIVAFFACYIPLVLFLISGLNADTTTNDDSVFIRVIVFIAGANSCINPFLYILRFQECHSEFLKIVYCCNPIKRERVKWQNKVNHTNYLDFSSTSSDGILNVDKKAKVGSSKDATRTDIHKDLTNLFAIKGYNNMCFEGNNEMNDLKCPETGIILNARLLGKHLETYCDTVEPIDNTADIYSEII